MVEYGIIISTQRKRKTFNREAAMGISKSQSFMNIQSKRSHIAVERVYSFINKKNFCVFNLNEVRNNERIR
jgi:hypothetical protein